MAATCRFRLLLGPPTLRDRDLCKMVVKISTWSALLYLAISNLCTRNYKQRQKRAKFNKKVQLGQPHTDVILQEHIGVSSVDTNSKYVCVSLTSIHRK